MNSSARLIYKLPRNHHVTPLLSDLHWLSVENRIRYKVACLSFAVVSGSAPPYLSDLLHVYTPSSQLRSSADSRIFRVPRRRRQLGQRAFSYFGPVVWNDLPFSLRHSPSLSTFKKGLKTHLFTIQVNSF